MEFTPHLSPDSVVPLYRQLYEQIALRIRSGGISAGEKLPATRELAGLLGLNRTTVSAAYELLESEGLIAGQVGRGSFVTGQAAAVPMAAVTGVNWSSLLDRGDAMTATHSGVLGADGISFVMSRPSAQQLFHSTSSGPVARRCCPGRMGDILQLGSPGGLQPLRRYLLNEARAQGLAGR